VKLEEKKEVEEKLRAGYRTNSGGGRWKSRYGEIENLNQQSKI